MTPIVTGPGGRIEPAIACRSTLFFARDCGSPDLFFVLVIDGDRFQIFGLEYGVAFQAPNIINSIAPVYELGANMLARLHDRYLGAHGSHTGLPKRIS